MGCLVLILLVVFIPIIGKISSSSQKTSTTTSSNTTSRLHAIDVAPGMTTEQLKSAKLRLRKNVDTVENITWYYHQNSPKYQNSRTAISINFGTSNNTFYTPNLSINYVASDWLFIQQYTVKADDAIFKIAPSYGKIKTDHGILSNGEVGIWEWYDNPISLEELQMVLAIIKSKRSVIRFEGKEYYKDYVIPEQEKLALKEVLASWKQMGGIFE